MSNRNDPQDSSPVSSHVGTLLRPLVATPAAPWNSRRFGAIIGALLIAVVLLVAGFGVSQNQQEGAVIGQFCTDLQSHSYGDAGAYGLLSATLRSQFDSADQFGQVMGYLDSLYGTVETCGLNETFRFPWIMPTLSSGQRYVLIHRPNASDRQGRAGVVREADGWKVDSLDASLLAVSLGGAAKALAYCNALQTLDFGKAWGQLSSSAQKAEPQVDFTRAELFHYVVDGQIDNCSISSFSPDNSNTITGLGMSILRHNHGAAAVGNVKLKIQGKSWVIDTIDPGLRGTDVGPLQVGYHFCDDLATGGLTQAYGLLTKDYQAQLPYTQFAKLFPGTYNGCRPDFSSYNVSQASASLSEGVNIVGNTAGGAAAQPAILHIALGLTQGAGGWAVSTLAVAQ